jgi:DNA gyrase subunit A
MKRSYIDYSIASSVGAPFPDVGTPQAGPQKIHYAMFDMGMPYNSPHKKSAKVVGEVLAKYHPHGDSAAYDSMVRMAQPFSLRYPWSTDRNYRFHGRGPRGRDALHRGPSGQAANEMLLVHRQGNLGLSSTTTTVPSRALRAASKLPNLLVNGSDGIAVGMATKKPPHNSESVRRHNLLPRQAEAETDELMEFVKGPTSPRAG